MRKSYLNVVIEYQKGLQDNKLRYNIHNLIYRQLEDRYFIRSCLYERNEDDTRSFIPSIKITEKFYLKLEKSENAYYSLVGNLLLNGSKILHLVKNNRFLSQQEIKDTKDIFDGIFQTVKHLRNTGRI